MLIAITTISILAITGFVWLLNRILPLRLDSTSLTIGRSGQAFKICPICAGVSGTWLWMLAAKFIGYEIDLIIPAMLMGGSIVGIAHQIEKRLPPSRSPLLWKTLFIPAGFVVVYSVISLAANPSNPSWWPVFIVITIFLAIWVLRFTKKPRSRADGDDKTASPEQSRRVEELEKKMKNCC